MTVLPEGLLAAWYGDDFAGAAATMEVFVFAGQESVLYLNMPTETQLARSLRRDRAAPTGLLGTR